MLPLRKIAPALVLLFVTWNGWAAGDGVGPPLAHIPSLRGTTFAGTLVVLPEALKGKVGVLVMGFSRSSQDSARAWGKRLAERYPAGSGVVYYEMPVVAGVPSLLREWVLGRIRQSVSVSAREHFLPIFDHEAEWKQATHEVSGKEVTVLVVDSLGGVRWRHQGTLSETAFCELEQQIVKLQR